MAIEYGSLATLRRKYLGITTVIIRTGIESPQTLEAASLLKAPYREWLGRDQVLGGFVLVVGSHRNQGLRAKLEAHFSDKDAAFHFKMRWA